MKDKQYQHFLAKATSILDFVPRSVHSSNNPSHSTSSATKTPLTRNKSFITPGVPSPCNAGQRARVYRVHIERSRVGVDDTTGSAMNHLFNSVKPPFCSSFTTRADCGCSSGKYGVWSMESGFHEQGWFWQRLQHCVLWGNRRLEGQYRERWLPNRCRARARGGSREDMGELRVIGRRKKAESDYVDEAFWEGEGGRKVSVVDLPVVLMAGWRWWCAR